MSPSTAEGAQDDAHRLKGCSFVEGAKGGRATGRDAFLLKPTS